MIPHLVEGGVSILYYVFYTILFLENNLKKAIIMKLILYIFEQLSILKINFFKSVLFLEEKREKTTIQTFFRVNLVLPSGTLGTYPLKKLRN